MRLDTTMINWNNIFLHPSEVTRLDEVLKIKQNALAECNCTNPGWSLTAANEIAENKRMVNNMRCFIQHQVNQVFLPGTLGLSDVEKQAMKTFSAKNVNFTGKIKDTTQLWYLIFANTDKRNTEKFYRHLLEQMIDWSKNPWEEDQQKNIDMIISKITFAID